MSITVLFKCSAYAYIIEVSDSNEIMQTSSFLVIATSVAAVFVTVQCSSHVVRKQDDKPRAINVTAAQFHLEKLKKLTK